MENIGGQGSAAIEAEIAQLTREIEAKRKVLEAQNGIVSEAMPEKGIVREVVAEHLSVAHESAPSGQTPAPQPAPAPKPAGQAASYLDSLDEVTATKVNELIQEVFAKGLDATIAHARREIPFVMDAFHDALVDRVYDELKKRDLVK